MQEQLNNFRRVIFIFDSLQYALIGTLQLLKSE